MQALIHIGMHKTGSTSIQHALGRLPLQGGRFFYPQLGGRANHSLAMHQMFSPEPERHQIMRKQGVGRDQAAAEGQSLRDALTEQLNDLSPDCIPIISGEYLSSCDEAVLLGLRDFLSSRGYCISIKTYVRAAADFIRSDFQQRIKGGASEFDVEASYPRYRRRFEKVERIFGRAAMEYWPFVPGQLMGGDVVTDFCSRVGLPVPDLGAAPRANDSLSRTALALLFVYRRLSEPGAPSPEVFREFRRVLSAIREIPGPRFALSPNLIAPVLARKADDIEWMSSRIGLDLGTLPVRDMAAVDSESHLLALGREALEAQAQRLNIVRRVNGAPEIEIIMRRLLREQGASRRLAKVPTS
jgi:hypothetical protein